MKSTILICVVLAGLSGVHAAPLPPEGTFCLTVADVVQTGNCRVMTLKIEARAGAEMMEISSEGRGGGSCLLQATPNGKGRVGEVILAAMRSHSDSPVVTATVLQTQVHGSSSSGGDSYDLPADTKLESIFSVALTNGVYRLNQPLHLGTRNGERLQFVVGNWNWNKVSRK